MRKFITLSFMVFLVLLMASFIKDAHIKMNGEVIHKDENLIMTLDEQNRVIHLDFTYANMSLLDDYDDKYISTDQALRILDEETYDKFPEEIKKELMTVPWTWNKGGQKVKGGIIAY